MPDYYKDWEYRQEEVYDQLEAKWLALVKDPDKAREKAQEEFLLIVNQ